MMTVTTRHILTSALAVTLLGLAAAAHAADPFVYETPREFTSWGDFDGDGLRDQLIVDKATGDYRIGYQVSPGVFTWAGPRAGGIADATSVAVGTFLSATSHAIALAAPVANRVSLFAATSRTTASNAIPVHPSPFGPHLVIATDVGGAGDTAHDDLYVGTSLNGPPWPTGQSFMRTGSLPVAPVLEQPAAAPIDRGNRVELKAGTNDMVAVLSHDGSPAVLEIHDVATTNSLILVATSDAVADETRYVHGMFSGGPLAEFLFYIPADTQLVTRAITEPVPGTFAFSAPVTNVLSNAIGQVYALPGAITNRLLVQYGSGDASVYDYDGVSPPTEVMYIPAPSGQVVTAVGILSSNNFLLYSGPSNGVSAYATAYAWNGSDYTPAAAQALPTQTAYTATANVFLFKNEPFVSSFPDLQGRLHSPDWTTHVDVSTSAPFQASVTSETFVSSSAGLDNPGPASLGQAPGSPAYGLGNQYLEPISIFSFAPAIGDEVVDVDILPAAGRYPTTIMVSFTSSAPDDVIMYRFSDQDSWTVYAAPFSLFADTTVSYFAMPWASIEKSVIREAVYTFTLGPDDLDSDNDGVPDYVELGVGLDPLDGDDSDGDGYKDKQEMLQGFDPASDASHPSTNDPPIEEHAAFDILTTPYPVDGTVTASTVCATGEIVRLHDLQGNLRGYTNTANLAIAGVPDPAVHLKNIVVDNRRHLVAVATEEHFDIATAHTNERIGRELLGLVPIPYLEPGLEVAYSYGGAPLPVEAANWIAAAQAATNTTIRYAVTGELSEVDVVVGVLVEKKIEEILLNRGMNPSNDVTLFPFRPTSVVLYNPSASEIRSLEQQIDPSKPGYLIDEIYDTLNGALTNPATAEVTNLLLLAFDTYRISSALGDTNAGNYASPVDVIRTFLHDGTYNSNYWAVSSLSTAQLVSAATACSNLLASVASRPTTNATLIVLSNSFTEACRTLDEDGGGPTFSLFFGNGLPYNFPEAFQLLAGSEISVLAYTDRTFGSCPGQHLEIIAIALEALPAPSVTDADGNLLPDDWEMFFNGTLSPFADLDGDGYSDFQEYLDGTDPGDPLSHSSTPVDLSAPEIAIANGPTAITVTWSYPASYADKVLFTVETTDDMITTPFADDPIVASHLGGGSFEALVPGAAGDVLFLRIYVTLP